MFLHFSQHQYNQKKIIVFLICGSLALFWDLLFLSHALWGKLKVERATTAVLSTGQNKLLFCLIFAVITCCDGVSCCNDSKYDTYLDLTWEEKLGQRRVTKQLADVWLLKDFKLGARKAKPSADVGSCCARTGGWAWPNGLRELMLCLIYFVLWPCFKGARKKQAQAI